MPRPEIRQPLGVLVAGAMLALYGFAGWLLTSPDAEQHFRAAGLAVAGVLVAGAGAVWLLGVRRPSA